MARPCKKSIYEQIEDIKLEISETEQRLISLKNQKKELEKQKTEQEMKLLYDRMKEQNMTFEEALSALTKSVDTELTEE